MTYREALELTVGRLDLGGIPSPVTEARELMEHFVGNGRFLPGVMASAQVDDKKIEELDEAVCRRLKGIPLQYILGSWTFMDCNLFVGEGVLIPRDDTEVCVRELIRFMPQPRDGSVIVDLCSGSGAIAIALASRYPGCRIIAIEYSRDAYEYLCRNIEANDAKNIVAYRDDITTCFDRFPDGSIDALISNPPYIRSSEIPTLQREVQFEPAMALDGGEDGLYFYRVIARHWVRKIKKSGIISLEIGEDQAFDVSSMLRAAGVRALGITTDIAGLDRTVSGIVQ